MSDDEIIAAGMAALERKLSTDGLPCLTDSGMVLKHALLRLGDSPIERALLYLLDRDRRLIAVEEVGVGAENSVDTSRRNIARLAVLHPRAETAVMVHNHPSGNPEPSEADKHSSERITHMLATVGVLALAHFVIGGRWVTDIVTGKRVDMLAAAETAAPCTSPTCPHCGGELTEN